MELVINATNRDTDVKRLWAYCFEKTDDPFYQWFFTHYYQPENVLGAWDQGKLRACLHLVPHVLFLRGQEVPVSYIVGLATFPEARGGGIIAGLLRESLREMRRRGHYAGILLPSQAGFYYPFHWELCYHHYHYNLPLADLVSVARRCGQFHEVTVSDGDIAALDSIYRQFVASKHGYGIRRPERWHQLLRENEYEKGLTYRVENDGRNEGYVMYVIRGRTLCIKDMAYTSLPAKQALYYFLYQHRSQAEDLSYYAPMDDVTYLELSNARSDIKITPFVAGRIADAAALLRTVSYPPDVNGRVKIAVSDELAAWNNQTFLLEVAGGRGQVTELGAVPADCTLTAGALAQLVFGRLEARELQFRQMLTAHSSSVVAELGSFFPKCNNYINEFF